MLNKLQKNILTTLCYYDVSDYPLTGFELWKYMIDANYFESRDVCEFSLSQVMEELESDELKNHIGAWQGFYFLKKRKSLVGKRIEANKLSNLKIRKMRKVVWFLRVAPFVRTILVTGRLAMKNARMESDWDVLIVSKKGRIWIARTFVTILSHILGKRRYGQKVQDRVCLNYYITDESLEISPKDLFSSNEYFFTFPIFDEGLFGKFQLKNKWIKKFRPNYHVMENGNLREVKGGFCSKKIRNFIEWVVGFDILEKWLKKVEMKKIKNNPKTACIGSLVNVSDEALVFLPKPQGPLVFEKFKKAMEKYF